MQRVRVGVTGLGIVLALIIGASAILSSATHDEPVAAIGASNAVIVANMTEQDSVGLAEKGKDEPLAELGVAPSAATPTPKPSATPTPAE